MTTARNSEARLRHAQAEKLAPLDLVATLVADELQRRQDRLIEEIADATLDGKRKAFFAELATVPLLIVDDLGMRKLPHTAAEDLLDLIMRRYERASTILTSNRPVDDWGKLLGDTAAVTALLDRLLHHAHIQVRAEKLAHENTDRLAHGDGCGVNLTGLGGQLEMAGSEVPTNGRT